MNQATKKGLIRDGIGVLWSVAGLAHFTHPQLFSELVPTTLDEYRSVVNVMTGLLQIAMGVTFFVPPLRAVARWSTIALLVLTLPAAIDQVIHPETIQSVGISPGLAAVCVLVQVLMIALIWWATAPGEPDRSAA